MHKQLRGLRNAFWQVVAAMHGIKLYPVGGGATDVQYASDDNALEALVLHVVPDFGPHGDGIINTNFLLTALKEKKRFRVKEGGLEFWRGILKAENSNFKWQNPTADMSAALQAPSARLRFPIQTFTGAVVLNELHKAQVKGRAMMKDWALTLREQAMSTIPNQFNSAFWNTAPGTAEPESVPNIISATPTTGTIGGLSRAGNPYLQNEAFTTAVTDIGSEGGISALENRRIRNAIGANDFPDLAIMDNELYAGLVGFLATLNRYRPDDRFAKLGFDTIKLGTMTISFENLNVTGSANTIQSGFVYIINSNHLNFEVLRDGNFKWNPKGFERVGMTMNSALYFWVFCNLTTNLPRAHAVMTNVSTS